jgi:hypothetical protein
MYMHLDIAYVIYMDLKSQSTIWNQESISESLLGTIPFSQELLSSLQQNRSFAKKNPNYSN